MPFTKWLIGLCATFCYTTVRTYVHQKEREKFRKRMKEKTGKQNLRQSGAPDSHLLKVTIPDAASIQFNLLVMSIKCSKHVEDYNQRTVK